MPDPRLGQGSEFTRYQRELSNWLHANVTEVRALGPREIEAYSWKHVVAGWEIRLPDPTGRFRVLLNDSFPYSRIQVAYKGEDKYLQWPHTEEKNFLCLPDEGWRPCENLEYSIAERLKQAAELVTNCQSEDFVRFESEREFLTYWGRQEDKLKALSIIDLTNTKPRKIQARLYDGGYILGENDQRLDSWLSNMGYKDHGPAIQAIFAISNRTPSLPLPKTGREFFRQILDHTPGLNGVFPGLSPFKTTLIIFGVNTADGIALFGAKFHPAPEKGFRPNPKPAMVMHMLRTLCRYTPIRVTRADSGWVHGRGQDAEGHQALSQSHVVVLGAGSLGSQIASRLAQAGMGRLSIIDPENLETSNIGRHALGIDCIDKNKASSLAQSLSRRYPHGHFEGFPERWQDVFQENTSLLEDADIIVSCMGEIEHDLSFDSQHQSGKFGNVPTVYGWLGTQGTTGHALALRPGGPALSCYFDLDGFIKFPDTEFTGGDQLRAEPACGTEFQPYGPLAAAQVALLVTRATIDILMGKAVPPFHRVCACSTEDLDELGGKWTDYHMIHRPDGYEGPFEYRVVTGRCNECHNCQ